MMSTSVRLLAAGMFRRDRFLAIVTTAVISVALAPAVAGEIAAERARTEMERLAVMRFGAISIDVYAPADPDATGRTLLVPAYTGPSEPASGFGGSQETLIGTIERAAAGLGLTMRPRIVGVAHEGERRIDFVAANQAEIEAWRTMGDVLAEPPGDGEYRVGMYANADGSLQWEPIPRERLAGMTPDGILVLELDWFSSLGVAPTSIASGPTADAFVRALEIEEALAADGITVDALAWPEHLGVRAYGSVGSLADVMRVVGAGAGLLAMIGVVVVAGRNRTRHVVIARTMGISNTTVRAAFGRSLTRRALLAVGITAGVSVVLALTGVVQPSELMLTGVLRSVIVALVGPGLVARLIAWRILGSRLTSLRDAR
jgi:hypothetical protein